MAEPGPRPYSGVTIPVMASEFKSIYREPASPRISLLVRESLNKAKVGLEGGCLGWAGDVEQFIECLPSMQETLDSIPRTPENRHGGACL